MRKHSPLFVLSGLVILSVLGVKGGEFYYKTEFDFFITNKAEERNRTRANAFPPLPPNQKPIDESENHLKLLLITLERMPARDAVKILNGLESETLFEIAIKLRQSTLSDILILLEPAKSAELLTKMTKTVKKTTDTPLAKAENTQ
jgi:flagellar motility protein MotE (MotC chaperone)